MYFWHIIWNQTTLKSKLRLMKSIRNIAFSVLLTLGAFSAVTYTSCSKDECKDVVCNNGGTCNETDGSCACPTGYTGTLCETEVRAKFIKSWSAIDRKTGSTTDIVYASPIVAGTAVTEVKIGNFSDLFETAVTATVNGNTITIPSQEPDKDGYKISGTGTYNETDKSISWTYNLVNPTNATQGYTGTWK
ncbi:MAG: hypothetical protein EOP56_03055 [Sphingobacteriales bacterium]|nr:MAG: hypothetical protein EOP56_03055 [Sphingobacteriales bacterium]